MKIVINSTSLAAPLSGIGRYTKEIVQCLLQAQLDNTHNIDDIRAFDLLHFYSPNELQNILYQLDRFSLAGQQKSTSNRLAIIKNTVKKLPGARRLKNSIQRKLFNKNMQYFKDAIYWEPNYILEAFDGISVPVIHDLSHLRYPEFHPLERRRWLDNNLLNSINNATEITTPSHFTKKEIIDVFAVNEAKISVVSPAVSDVFRQNYSTEEKQQLRQNYQLPEHFILSVSTLEPRKNITGLIASYQQLPEMLKKHYPLVIVGSNGWLNNDLENKMRPLQAKGQLIRLGYIAQAHLPLLYAIADVFVYISHYEGYGMPVAEAMCSGIPVITSNISSMPEVAAGCAQLVNPLDRKQIAFEIQQLIEDKTLRNDLIAAAKIKSTDYTWNQSAQKLLQLFSRLSS